MLFSHPPILYDPTLYVLLYKNLYAEDMSRKNFKVKTNYLRHDPFYSFQAFGNLSHCQQQLLTTCDNVFNKKYLLDNYNHLRHNNK